MSLADLAGRGVAVEHRHLAVHQHGVVRHTGHRFDRLFRVRHHVHPVAEPLKHPRRHLLIDDVVLRDQHSSAHLRPRSVIVRSHLQRMGSNGDSPLAVRGHGAGWMAPMIASSSFDARTGSDT